MGQPVVHFEIIGKDPDRVKAYYSELFGWETEPAVPPDADDPDPMNYGMVSQEQNQNPDGIGIGGGIGGGIRGTTDTSPSTSRSPASRMRSPRRRASAALG